MPRVLRAVSKLSLIGLVLALVLCPNMTSAGDKNRDLIIASMKGNLEEVRRLLDSGADVNARDQKGWTALEWALKAGHSEVAQLLRDRGAGDDAKAKAILDGKLIQATKNGDLTLIKTLLDKGADIYAKDRDGWTALTWAWGNAELIKLFIARGAKMTLAIAAAIGDVGEVQRLIKDGADLNAKDEAGWTPLMHAAQRGVPDVVKLLLDNGVNVRGTDEGARALAIAMEHRNKEITDLLRARGAESVEGLRIDKLADKVARRGTEYFFRLRDGTIAHTRNTSSDEWSGFPVRYTFDDFIDPWYVIEEIYYESYGTRFINRDTGAVKTVDGSSSFSPDKTRFLAVGYPGESPCDAEIWSLSPTNIMREWVAEGHCFYSYQWSGTSTVNVTNSSGHEMIATVKHDGNSWECSGSADICKRADDSPLSDSKATSETTNDSDSTALTRAAADGHLDKVKNLLDKGTDINAKDKDGETALFSAARGGQWDMVKLLLDNGAAIDIQGNFGPRALLAAAKDGHLGAVKVLLDKGVDIQRNDDGGWTPLIAAASEGRLEVVKLLLERGAEVNAKDKHGRSALMSAAIRGHSKVVKLLLDKGAEVNAKDKEGWTALMDASWSGNRETVSLLLAKGADVNASTERGETALMNAAVSSHMEIVKLLLDAGANVNSKPKFGQTALKIAQERGPKEIEELLRARGAKE